MQVAVGRLQRQSSLIRHQQELYIPWLTKPLVSSKATTGTPTGTNFKTHGYENTSFSLCIISGGDALQSRPFTYVLGRSYRIYIYKYINCKKIR
nr:MAG TPA: hypothetical protein [Caudoviricetes sp.]